eukprot:14808782-Alexandrium_andersonii.AAC.1
MSASLVGSEMCIRDSLSPDPRGVGETKRAVVLFFVVSSMFTTWYRNTHDCLLYTSDAADDM